MAKIDINLSFLSKYKDHGLLIARVGIGIAYLLLHGWGKITGGPDRWIGLGKNMPGFGVDAIYMFWGFMASLAESLGGLLLALGYKTRLVATFLAITMLVAVYAHLSGGDGWRGSSHALKMMFVMIAFMTVGAGKFSLDRE